MGRSRGGWLLPRGAHAPGEPTPWLFGRGWPLALHGLVGPKGVLTLGFSRRKSERGWDARFCWPPTALGEERDGEGENEPEVGLQWWNWETGDWRGSARAAWRAVQQQKPVMKNHWVLGAWVFFSFECKL